MIATRALAKSGSNAARQRNRNQSNRQSGSGKSSTIIECSNWSISRGYNSRRTNGGKDSSMRTNSACGFGRVEWRPLYMATNGKPRTTAQSASCMIDDCRSRTERRWFRRHIAMLRKKLFGTLAIKRFDVRMINLNGRSLVTVGIKLFY